MARQKMQKCKDCGYHSLSTTCPQCGGVSPAAAPMKWSPETREHTLEGNSTVLKRAVGQKHCLHWLQVKKNDANHYTAPKNAVVS